MNSQTSPRYLLVTVVVCLATGLIGFFAGRQLHPRKSVSTEAPSGTLANSIMSQVRNPGRFNEPKDAVTFLLEQIRQQNIEEASRVFPIREWYENATFEATANWLGAVSIYPNISDHTPLPTAPLQNAIRSLGFLYTTFEKSSLTLLGFDPATTITAKDGKFAFSDSELGALAKQLDRSRLNTLKVKSFGSPKQLPLKSNEIWVTALKCQDRVKLEAVVECDAKEYTLEFFLVKIDGSWRIL